MNWTKKDIDNLKLSHNLTVKKKKTNVPIKKLTVNGKISVEKESIRTLLWVFRREGLIPDFVEELRFHDQRKFRFDWAIPSLKIAIEYEGTVSEKSRHTTIKGYSNDTTKYNLATINGWRVLRYTALTYKNLPTDLKKILKIST